MQMSAWQDGQEMSGWFVSNQQASVLLIQVSTPGHIAGTCLVQCTDVNETIDGVSSHQPHQD